MPLPILPPTPRTWAADDLITVPRLRADVANSVAFLNQRPQFAGQNNLGTGIANNTNFNVGWNIELSDVWNSHVVTSVNGANSAQFWAPVPGWYLCQVIMPFFYPGATAAPFAAGFNWITGGTAAGPFYGAVETASNILITPSAVDLIEQTGSGSPGGSGDWISPIAWQASGSSVDLSSTTGYLPSLFVRWVCTTTGFTKTVPANATVPSPITHAWLNANVRDTIQFLAYPPICKAVYTPGSATMPSGALNSPSIIDLTTVSVDNYSGFTTGTSAKYTAPVTGVYFIHGQFNLTASSTACNYAAGLSVNGAAAQWGDIVWFDVAAATAGGASVTRRLRLNAGDTVQLVGTQGSGSTLGYAGGSANQTRFIAVWDGS